MLLLGSRMPGRYEVLIYYPLIALLFFFIAGGNLGFSLLRDYSLATSGKTVTAEIVKVSTHNSCTYRFSVENTAYEQLGRSCDGNSIGSKILVYYLPDNPGTSTNGNPAIEFKGDVAAFIFFVIFMPCFFLFTAYTRYKRQE